MANVEPTVESTGDLKRVLHVEIGPLNGENERSVRLRRGDTFPADAMGSEPDTATSLDALSRLLSERNVQLLKLIKSAKPRSVAELARKSGRPKASLTLTLRRLEKFGIIAFKDMEGRRRVPSVVCDRLMLDLNIDQDLDAGQVGGSK